MSERTAEAILDAQRELLIARARFRGTFEEAQRRLAPEQLFADAAGQMRARGLSLTGQAVESLRSRPLLSTAAATLVGLLINHRAEIFAVLKMILRRRATSKPSRHSASGEPKSAVKEEIEA